MVSNTQPDLMSVDWAKIPAPVDDGAAKHLIGAKLADVALRAAKPAKGLRKLSDGKGLQFWITPQGGRYWRYEYRFEGKRKLLALGTYPEVSVSKAREKAKLAREHVAAGHDPSEYKRQTKIASRAAQDAVFSKIAARLVAKKRKAGKSEATIGKMEWILRKVEGAIGSRPITAITVQEIVRCFAKEEEAGKFETAIHCGGLPGRSARAARRENRSPA